LDGGHHNTGGALEGSVARPPVWSRAWDAEKKKEKKEKKKDAAAKCHLRRTSYMGYSSL
jgi:hypothetical protein